ncbi:MAG: hypothetical protein QME59_03660 [Candidatus Hydrothermarchaeota archaeon]|nr:hypothetical protein [Candidatus Hydrothermarchaeota archaeon]
MMKDVNFTFLWLILLLLASMAGMSIYYQDTYGGALERYTVTKSELEKTASEAEAKESTLNKVLLELNIAKEREAVLSGKYDTLRGEKEILENEKKNLQIQLKDTQSELASLKLEYGRLREDLASLQRRTNALESLASALLSQNIELQNQLSACEASK